MRDFTENIKKQVLYIFWSDRFISLIVEKGEALINCLAYIDLNPVRAGIVERPEDFRWNSLGYHIQTNNKDGFLSTDFGLKEFNVKSEKKRVRRYRVSGVRFDNLPAF